MTEVKKNTSVSPVYTVQTECQDCYKCIRRCPVKAIKVENGHAAVIGEYCIACGRCVINCPAHAKHYRNDISLVEQILRTKQKVIISLAPSFKSEFPEFSDKELILIAKKLGFFGVSETAIGADFVSHEIAELLESKKRVNEQKLFLSSACPAVVEFIKKYLSEFTPYITDCASPLLAHARYLHKLYGEDVGVVFVGPCIAKKREADSWNEIDASITFKEFKYMIEPFINDIKKNSDKEQNESFIPQRACKAELFPLEGGMIAACKKYHALTKINTIAVSGIESIKQTLKGLNPADLEEPLFLELLSCTGGCINGPGSTQTSAMALRRVQTVKFADSAEKVMDQRTLKQQPEMNGTIPCDKSKQNEYTDEQIHSSLRSIGKYTIGDEINCNGCGYDTCRCFAKALLDGVAEKTMCVSYTRKLAQKKANGLVAAIPSGVVIADRNMHIVECNKNFAKIMGQDIAEMYDIKPGMEGADLAAITKSAEFFKSVLAPNGPDVIEREVHEANKILHYTVFVIEKEESAAGVVEDVTAPKNQRERTITQAQKVIDKNLSVVQKIAFLLGENAAETESMLNSIIESYNIDEGKKDD